MNRDDRRSVVRRRTLFAGRIVVNAAGSSMDVKVRNLSPRGARIEAYGLAFMPEAFSLRIIHTGASDDTHEARRVWTDGEHMGVVFRT